jgi:cytochrome c-type biogenesis protein CcmE
MLNGQPNMTLKTLTQIAVALGEGIDLFVPSSVREERQRALEARLAEQRAQHVAAQQARWRTGGVVVSGNVQRLGAADEQGQRAEARCS